MATQTPKYKLIKQGQEDYYNVDILNGNMDLIDTVLKEQEEAIGDVSSQLAQTVKKDGSVPMDDLTVGIRKTGSAVGDNSFTSGTDAEASGSNSTSMGYQSIAKGGASHAEGSLTKAYSTASHAEGYNTQVGGSSTDEAVGTYAHAEGNTTAATGNSSHAEGLYSIAKGNQSHAENDSTLAVGAGSHVEGYMSSAMTGTAHAEGSYTFASTGTAYAVSAFNNTTKTVTLASVAGLAVNDKVDVRIIDNIGEPDVTIAAISGLVVTLSTTKTITAKWTHLIKRNTDGWPAHVEGTNCMVSGISGHAEGVNTYAIGSYSHAEGENTQVFGVGAHSEGVFTIANGSYSHAGGDATRSNGYASFAHGQAVIADSAGQAVFGRYNAASSTDLFQVGMGTSDSDRKNAFAIGSNGQMRHKPTMIVAATQAGMDALLNNLAGYEAGTYYRFVLGAPSGGVPLNGGTWLISGYIADGNYGFQIAEIYNPTGMVKKVRSKWEGTWNAWVDK